MSLLFLDQIEYFVHLACLPGAVEPPLKSVRMYRELLAGDMNMNLGSTWKSDGNVVISFSFG